MKNWKEKGEKKTWICKVNKQGGKKKKWENEKE